MMLPNQFRTSSEGIDPKDVAVVSYGVPRSATTFIFQVLRDLHPQGGVIKTHCYLDFPQSVPVVGTYRDFRDVCVSFWRTQCPDRACMTEEEIVRVAAICRLWVVHLDRYAERRNVVLIKYEEFWRVPSRLFDTAAPFRNLATVGYQPKTEKRNAILTAHTLEKNRGLKLFEDTPDPSWEGVSGVGPMAVTSAGHIHDGWPDRWKEFTTRSGGRLLTELLQPELDKWGYLDS